MADESHTEDHDEGHDAMPGHDGNHGHAHSDHGHDDHGHDDHGHGHHDPFAPAHLMGHIKDADYFEVPRALDGALFPTPTLDKHGEATTAKPDGKIYLPQPLKTEEPIWQLSTGNPQIDPLAGPLDLKLTKYMVIEVIVAVICIVVFGWLAQKVRGGGKPVGKVWNFLETFLVFIRDEVARPAIGRHDADKFLPFLWSIFFFVLGCNLLGMIPWLGSPTGSLATTGGLAFVTFATVVGAGMLKLGPVGFWKAQVPHMDLPLALAILLKPMIFAIEVLGLFIKHFVLAVRLLANMMAGHMVLAVLVAFVAAIGAVATSYFSPLFIGVSVASIIGALLISLLELFVAFLQAYIFTFLSALFIGMAVHPH